MTQHVYDALILGAGYGGLGMGAQLRRKGLENFIVLEKSDRVGGVWRDNSYPGAACDTQSHIYCYSYHLNLRVSALFAGRDELLSYLYSLVQEFGLSEKIRLNTEIMKAHWDAGRALWVIETTRGAVYLARTFVPAWGQLTTPNTPPIEGMDRFRGDSFHSARWNHNVDLSGKRVASIGAAASAVQYVPEVAKAATDLVVFQRSANYILPRGQKVFAANELDAFEQDPELFMASRNEIHRQREAGFSRMKHDTSAQEAAVSEARAHLEAQIPDPELRRSLTPDYEFGCKRVLRSDEYYPALMRPNVQLETGPIREMTEQGVITADGRNYEFDVIIFGTGFRSQTFQGELDVIGRDGVPLSERWAGTPEAYLGLSVDGFPNMFMIYGPNTNLNHNSVVTMMEIQQDYIVQCVEHLIKHPGDVLEVRPEILRAYNEWLQGELEASSYASDCSSWYKNADGRVINNWCGTVEDYRALGTLSRSDFLAAAAMAR